MEYICSHLIQLQESIDGRKMLLYSEGVGENRGKVRERFSQQRQAFRVPCSRRPRNPILLRLSKFKLQCLFHFRVSIDIEENKRQCGRDKSDVV